MTPSEDAKLDVLHSHYADTFDRIARRLAQRDRLFLYAVVAISVMLIQVVAPEDSDAALAAIVGDKLGLPAPLRLSVLGSVLWFVLLGLLLRYFQAVIYVERQYGYVHSLEGMLNTCFGGKAFTREGESYSANYPLFSKWAWWLYTVVFPVVIVLVLAVKLGAECRPEGRSGWLLAFDATAFATIATSTALYTLQLHFRR